MWNNNQIHLIMQYYFSNRERLTYLFLYFLFIFSIAVLRRTQAYLIFTTGTSIMMLGNHRGLLRGRPVVINRLSYRFIVDY